jgi:hypothetical protein
MTVQEICDIWNCGSLANWWEFIGIINNNTIYSYINKIIEIKINELNAKIEDESEFDKKIGIKLEPANQELMPECIIVSIQRYKNDNTILQIEHIFDIYRYNQLIDKEL